MSLETLDQQAAADMVTYCRKQPGVREGLAGLSQVSNRSPLVGQKPLCIACLKRIHYCPHHRKSKIPAGSLRVLRLMVLDLNDTQIAQELNLASVSVKSHIRKLRLRLGMQTRYEIAQWALEHWDLVA